VKYQKRLCLETTSDPNPIWIQVIRPSLFQMKKIFEIWPTRKSSKRMKLKSWADQLSGCCHRACVTKNGTMSARDDWTRRFERTYSILKAAGAETKSIPKCIYPLRLRKKSQNILQLFGDQLEERRLTKDIWTWFFNRQDNAAIYLGELNQGDGAQARSPITQVFAFGRCFPC